MIGLGALQTGQIFLKLMKRLGHNKFYAQGGDWGSLVVTDMATMYPNRWVMNKLITSHYYISL